VTEQSTSPTWRLLEAGVLRDGDRPAVTFAASGTWTRRSLLELAQRVGDGLQNLGVSEGDRVAVMLGNRVELVATWLACLRIGAIFVPLNTGMRGPILEHMLRVAGPVVLIDEPSVRSTARAALDKAVPSARPIHVDPDGDESIADFAVGWEQLSAQPTGCARPVPHEAGRAAYILFTSGTTGPSKGVAWAEETALALTAGADRVAEYGEADIGYVSLPLFHANGLFVSLLPALVAGAHTFVDERFSLSSFWTRVRETEATVTSLLGIMEPLLLSQQPSTRDRDHQLRRALLVPAPRDRTVFHDRFGAEVRTFYALTDVGMPIAGVSRDGSDAMPAGSCGRALPEWECAVVDQHDTPVAPGIAGQLVVRPHRPWTTALEYWQDADATVRAWRNLWLHTGDLMTVDEAGWFYFKDRAKDAIRRSGENVSSYEVESVLAMHPDVAESAVYGVASDLAEDEVMACVVLRATSRVTAQELAAHCREQLPYFAVPRYIELSASLPRTESQKIRKDLLRNSGVTDTTHDMGRTTRDMVKVSADTDARASAS